MKRFVVLAALVFGGCVQSTTEPRPASPEVICNDGRIGHTFGGDTAGCREYLDACLGDLTESQRSQWRRAVDSCLHDDSQLFTCYSDVPFC